MAANDDEESQKKGSVCVVLNVGESRANNNPIGGVKLPGLTRALPNRWASFHYCVDDQSTATMVNLAVMFLGSRDRARFRKHVGKFQCGILIDSFIRYTTFLCSLLSLFFVGAFKEVRYKLMSFGIPVSVIPITDDGTFPLDNHMDWMRRRQKLEETVNENYNAANRPFVPGPRDVLCGRSKLALSHPGNVRYRTMIEDRKADYDKAAKPEKTKIASNLVLLMQQTGARFLKPDADGNWVHADNSVARDKVSNAFRDRRKIVSASAASRSKSSSDTNTKPKRDDILPSDTSLESYPTSDTSEDAISKRPRRDEFS